MTLLLTLEQGPRPQAVREARLENGELVIGRSADSDWQIDDPDMFVSRSHCRIAARPDGFFITDTSSSGLFIDDSADPLGSGNTLRLHDGMRLRLGDYVVRAEVQAPRAIPVSALSMKPVPAAPSKPPPSFGLGGDDFFSVATEEQPKQPRPANLPRPFENVEHAAFKGFENQDAERGQSAAFDDPFSLDPVSTPIGLEPGRQSPEKSGNAFGFDMPFDLPAPSVPEQPSPLFDDGFGIARDKVPEARIEVSPAPPASNQKAKRAPWELPEDDEDADGADAGTKDNAPAIVFAPEKRPAAFAERPDDAPGKTSEVLQDPPLVAPSASKSERGRALRKPAASVPSDTALRAAFFRGLGLDDDETSRLDPIDEMEKFGREYRLMMDGLMQLLRKRAEEKSNARVAQTVVGSSAVNPLKFLPTVDDALVMIVASRSAGFLEGEAAIVDTVRDLAQHHVRAWRGVQSALRRMIDRFDPASIEEELKTGSGLGSLLSGGRGAKLWELYQKRHREIATNAESRFLGDIGADFRDAYEEE